ncbi:MAG TPA: TonB-dependent receptor plug domain-containing protein [Bacteroidales bacterium]|jgi:TonB-dependent SusC/RagA subfamily outer membrane receptor|nr:TonB-dependent receptor plug domain-containing protein [Bacteroidales bacterium]
MKIPRPSPFWFVIIFSILILILTSFADEDPRARRLTDALHKYTALFPQQKVYLHSDKKEYNAGDVIWIKAYIVNGLDHVPDTFSTNLYLELISPFQSRVEIKRIQMFNGFGIGDFHLSDTLPEGLYQLRAYTAWMQNFDTEYFFEKNFQVNNPGYTRLISPKQARINKKQLADRSEMNADVDIQFLPEGGYLVNGLESVVGFKAVNKLGKGVDVEGTIYDEKGNSITSFKTSYKGIGTLRITPQKGAKYYAEIKGNERIGRIHLDEALESGLVMHIENNPDKIIVYLTSNRHEQSSGDVIVTGQVGGRMYFNEIVNLKNGKATLSLNRNNFPSGIMQITTFSGRGTPLAERLVFSNFLGYMKIMLTATDSITDQGKKIAIDIRTLDRTNRPIRANLSLSVTREISEQKEVNSDNILSDLLLLSDLKGYIEDPLDYFKLPAEEFLVTMDNLMLTQGWRRFDWNSILAGDYPEIRFHEEKGITVSGRITRDFFNLPLDDCRVQLSIMDKYNDVFTQYSSDKGTFVFDNLVYYDTISVKIEAWRPSGRRNLVILLAENEDEEVVNQLGNYTLTTISERDKKAHREEVVEDNKKAYEREKLAMEERKKNSIQGIYGEPDFVLYNEDFHMVSGNILDVMKGRVPGVMITGDDVLIRGINTLYGNTQPLYLVDGTPVTDVNAVTSIPLQDIERVEVLKGPKTSFYGSRGANGVIAVYTKRGQFMIRGKIEFDMLGYSTPRRFYQPKYEASEEPETNYTLLWEPLIVTNADGRAKIILDKPSIQGNYRFDLQGISYSGHVGYLETISGNEE